MRRRALPFVVTALVLASACGTGAATPSKESDAAAGAQTLPTEATVRLPKSYRFEPDRTEVATGAVVTWINKDDFPHTVRLLDDSGVDKKLGVGDTTSITFDEPGTYRYDCSLHPTQMKGSVVVRDQTS